MRGMDGGPSKKAQFKMTISTEKDAVDYPFK
jgi:hypothetical protein